MPRNCLHHPLEPSHWHCPFCNGDFCESCATERKRERRREESDEPPCPRCNHEMTWVGSLNALVPFWARLHRFFFYPLKPTLFLFVLLLAMASATVPITSVATAALQIIPYALLMRYAYLVLRSTAIGNLTAPNLSGVPLGSAVVIVFKQLLLFSLASLMAAYAYRTYGTRAIVGMGPIFVLFFPAIMILLVSSNRVLHALNPLAFGKLAYKIGKGYLGMFSFLAILWGGSALVLWQIAPLLEMRLLQFAGFLVVGYAIVVSYHFMGYVTLQYHDRLGYDVKRENFRTDAPAPQPAPLKGEKPTVNSPHIPKIEAFFQEGKLEEALAYLEAVRTRDKGIHHPKLAGVHFRLLKAMKQQEKLLEFAQEYLEILVKEKKKHEAIRVWQVCTQKSSDFLAAPHILYELGLWVSDAISPGQGVAIFQKAVRAYPKDPIVPLLWFRSAKILNDRMHEREKAIKLLQGILRSYPAHEIRPQVENYLAAI